MSNLQFGRNYELTISKDIEKNGLVGVYEEVTTIRNLRMNFSVSKEVESLSGKAVVQVYNLSRSNREALTLLNSEDNIPNLFLELKVGYGNTIYTICRGKALAKHQSKLPEVVSTFEISDGLFEQITKQYAKNWGKGTPYNVIIKDLLSTIGLENDKIDSVSGTLPEVRAFNGVPTQLLYDLGSKLGFRYIVDNSFQSIEALSTSPTSVFNISPDSGLIDIPYQQGNMMHVTCLLNPQLKVNSYVNIESSELNSSGTYRIVAIKSVGDTYGNQWVMKITVAMKETITLLKEIVDDIDKGVIYG